MRNASFVVAFVILFGAAAPASLGGVRLKAIRFPIDLKDTSGPKAPPSAAPLSQRVVFEFDGKPQIGPGVAEGLRVRVSGQNVKGQPVGELAFGDYEVSGNRVIFTPRLPTSALGTSFGATSDVASDTSLPGLRPDTTYEIAVTLGTPNSVKNLTEIASGVSLPLQFRTTAGVPGPFLVQSLFSNAPLVPPKLKPEKTLPAAGAKGVHPNLYTDPAGLFTAIPASKRLPVRLRFKGPLDPAEDNLGADRFELHAVLSPDGTAVDAPIGSRAVLSKNTLKESEVLIYPEGALPLGYEVSVRVSTKLRALSGASADPAPGAGELEPVASFSVAKDKHAGAPIDDALYEDFDTDARSDTTLAGGGGGFQQLAGWDAGNSNALRASFGFGGDGTLGRLLPPDETLTITLDTDFQQLPLFSGATPDVPAGTVVKGGVFHFTDVYIPSNVTLRGKGTHPLIITATGDVLIEGTIDLDGQAGTNDDTFDSAITPTPGGTAGAGGGRGGDSHPVYVPKGATSLKFIQTPQFAQTGFGPGTNLPGGGGGGQCGATMPWSSFTTSACTQYSGAGDGSRGSGGGGGSFNVFFPNAPESSSVPVSGRRGAVGTGNHLPVEFKPQDPIPGTPGTATEKLAYMAGEGPQTENAVARKSPNPTFAEAYLAGMIFDNGTKMNVAASNWAKNTRVTFGGDAGPAVFDDPDPDNDFIGIGGELSAVQGGQGGGGAGSRTEGLSQICKPVIFDQSGLPFTVLDAKGGGGGGAGGALLIQALGTITIQGSSAHINARGGQGGGGEQTGDSVRGGAAGGGSGGCVVLQSATLVTMNDPSLPSPTIDVSGGCGRDATTISGSAATGIGGGETGTLQYCDGGPGGPGIVQIHTPDATQVNVARVAAKVNLSAFNISCTTAAQVTISPLVDMAKTPTPLSSRSVARSTWYDLGAVTGDFRPPLVTGAGALAGPLFGVPGIGPFFRGTDPQTGRVRTDAAGNVLDPYTNDLDVDSPDLLKNDFLPNGPVHFQSVTVTFQGADEDPSNPGSPELATATGFVSDITGLNGRRFVRWQVEFDIADGVGGVPQPATPRPQLNFLRIPFKF